MPQPPQEPDVGKTQNLCQVICMSRDANTNTATQETATLPSTAGVDLPLQQTLREDTWRRVVCARRICAR